MSKRRSEPAPKMAQALAATEPLPVLQRFSPLGPNPAALASDAADASLQISHYSWLLRTHFAKIVSFISLVVIATALVTVRLPPIYESTATLFIDRSAEREVVGKDSETSAAAASADADVFLASQIKLLQTDAVVRPLAEKFNLLEKEKQIVPGKDDPVKISRIRSGPIILKGLRITR